MSTILNKPETLEKNVTCCDLKYSREPGFYFGAMFVSYALGVALFVTIWVATAVLYPEYSSELLLGIIIGAILILGPYCIRSFKNNLG